MRFGSCKVGSILAVLLPKTSTIAEGTQAATQTDSDDSVDQNRQSDMHAKSNFFVELVCAREELLFR